ncbi:MAG: MtnX-like HAD-IB family phosphatase [Candidatus Zixiibacteriota bacterium]|nr:MAG: MtnX-like HAD-IB family phosphatase [candidate division Zixibacteria bacterium]
MRKDYIVFVDFDGTITAKDVGYEMFRKFTDAKTQPVVDRYRLGKVNSYTCLKTECEIWNRFPPEEKDVLEYLKKQGITDGFADFTEILRNDHVKMYIVSEGFDFYIEAILNSNGFSKLDRITNKAVYKNGEILPDFPFLGQGCGECSNCKGFHIKKLTDPKSSAIFIGDGHSDFHGAGAADIVFAKSFLKKDLEKTGRNYFEYGDFYDIIEIWREISSRKLFAFSERLFFCRISGNRRNDFENLWETGEVMKNVGYPQGLGWSNQRYDKFWETLDRKSFVLFAVEDKNGRFMGEAKLSFPDEDNSCSHDVKLLPEYQGKGYGREAWGLLMELSRRRWPDSIMSVTPSVENAVAIELYKSLGFEFDGEQREWIPSSESPAAVPVRYRRMIKF